MSQVTVVTAALDAVMVEFEALIDAGINAEVIALQQCLAQCEQVLELVPSYRCLMVYYNPLKHREADMRELIAWALAQPVATERQQQQLRRIEVCYDPQLGLDLAAVAAQTKLTLEQVIALHCEPEYLVYTLGFAPGFAYLGDVPEPLRLPRLATPRQQVPALSVAIAQQQTAIYPQTSPGGWLVLGRALELPQLAAGDRVRFVPISWAQYQQRLAP
jgi:KipI family sensor histidine kinase inhibitor